MNSLIALVGAGEYLPIINEVDRHLLESVNTNGRAPRVVCIPTAAGQESKAHFITRARIRYRARSAPFCGTTSIGII